MSPPAISNNNKKNRAAAPSQQSQQQQQRIAAHSHITGLSGPDCGFTGQAAAREALQLWARLIQRQRVAGRAVLLVGPPGTGKTALAVGLSKELGPAVPFGALPASRIYSAEVSATAVLQTHVRQAVGVRLRETKEVYEGCVTELTVQETVDALQTYGRTISHVVLTLKTTKGTQTLQLDPTMYESLQKERVAVGDVIYIEANSGAVKRVGRSDTYAAEFDLESEEYVAIPKGAVHKKKQVVQDVTLHDLDVANAHPSSGGNSNKDVSSLLAALQRPKQTEITDKLRREINAVVQKYVDDGVAELVPGVLFLDEVHMLDLPAFTFLHKTLESPLSPILVLATNRGLTKLRPDARLSMSSSHTNAVLAPHGIPSDFLDRLLMIPTHPYGPTELRHILQTRARIEKLSFEPNDNNDNNNNDSAALTALTEIGTRTSLRYAVQLLTPAAQMAAVRGLSHIDVAAVQLVHELFLDGKASAQLLQQQSLKQPPNDDDEATAMKE